MKLTRGSEPKGARARSSSCGRLESIESVHLLVEVKGGSSNTLPFGAAEPHQPGRAHIDDHQSMDRL